MSRKQAKTRFSFNKQSLLLCALVALACTYSSVSYASAKPSFIRNATSTAPAPVSEQPESTTMRTLKQIRDTTSEITENALDLIGIRYKRGGTSIENGLDCSGFVRLVFKKANEAELPRTAKEMSQEGESVEKTDLKPGDLVFFNTMKRSFSHVGIYLGENKFIHSPRAGGKVRVESMSLAYWKKRFNGARRISEESAQK